MKKMLIVMLLSLWGCNDESSRQGLEIISIQDLAVLKEGNEDTFCLGSELGLLETSLGEVSFNTDINKPVISINVPETIDAVILLVDCEGVLSDVFGTVSFQGVVGQTSENFLRPAGHSLFGIRISSYEKK